MPLPGEQANQQMVDRQIAEGALWTGSLIAAFRETPRHKFIDRVFQYQRKQNRWREMLTTEPGPAELRVVYSDRALVTQISPPGTDGSGTPVSSSSQPSLMAQMLQDLQLRPGLRVLEIGSGTGYNAALLAHVVGPNLVFSIDVDREVLSEAWAHLRAFSERSITLRHADGRHGLADEAPFDRIMVTAATPDLEPDWLEQLTEGGILLAPLALAPGLAYVVRGTVCDKVFEGKLTRAAYFMPLRAEGETGAEEPVRPPPGEVETQPAPWAGWFDRRKPRASWFGFVQALAFYAFVKGLSIHYQTLTNGEPAYGVEQSGHFCWLGSQNWQVSGRLGRELGWGLWRTFLDAGGPRPTEFRFRAAPDLPTQAQGARDYFRQGPRCRQLWQQIEPVERPYWL